MACSIAAIAGATAVTAAVSSSSVTRSSSCCRATPAAPLALTRTSFYGCRLLTTTGQQWQRQLRRGVAGRVHASLLGVGAPEFLVIGVVALLVFGPKGLAEVARNLGKALKAFQPTIQELQQVSREFKSTLEQEMGLDEFRSKPPTYQQGPPPPQQGQEQSLGQNGSPNPARAYTSEEYMKVTEEQAKALVPEEMRREAELSAWGSTPPNKAGVETPAKEDVLKEDVIKEDTPREES